MSSRARTSFRSVGVGVEGFEWVFVKLLLCLLCFVLFCNMVALVSVGGLRGWKYECGRY